MLPSWGGCWQIRQGRLANGKLLNPQSPKTTFQARNRPLADRQSTVKVSRRLARQLPGIVPNVQRITYLTCSFATSTGRFRGTHGKGFQPRGHKFFSRGARAWTRRANEKGSTEMKKELIALSTTFALTACLGLAACGGAQQAAQTNGAAATEATTQTQAPAADKTTTEAPAEKTTTEKATTEAPAPKKAKTEAPAAQAPAAEATPAPAPANSYIGNDAALDAALRNAGLGKSDVFEVDVDLDTDDGTPHYDVEFKNGANEYDYDIDATNGGVLTKDVHVDVDD